MDHVEHIAKRDRRCESRGIRVILKRDVDWPLGKGIVHDAHVHNGWVRRGSPELVIGEEHGLTSARQTDRGEVGRGEVKEEVLAGELAVEEGVELEARRGTGPGGGEIKWHKFPAKGPPFVV